MKRDTKGVAVSGLKTALDADGVKHEGTWKNTEVNCS